MKNFSLFVILFGISVSLCAQINMYVWMGGERTKYPVTLVDSVTFAEEPPFAPLISVTDASVSDWRDVPSDFLATATSVPSASNTALKNVKVYADQKYINVLVEFDPVQITDKSWVPFHMYINTDNSAATGGFGDQWSDADTDILLEGAVFENNQIASYDPTLFQWTGTLGGNGWTWGAIAATGSPIGASQMVGNKIEIQIVREYIPTLWNNIGFTIGFDIQQNWSSVGILPNAANGEKGNKLPVVIDWENHADQPSQPENPTAETTVTYTSTDALFPNPERGFLKQIYYTSQQLNSVQTANTVRKNRENENVTLYLDNYFMMDYISSDISQAFLNRME